MVQSLSFRADNYLFLVGCFLWSFNIPVSTVVIPLFEDYLHLIIESHNKMTQIKFFDCVKAWRRLRFHFHMTQYHLETIELPLFKYLLKKICRSFPFCYPFVSSVY